MTTEDRLRQLLRDPGWSLPAWPDAQARVRRAARRQRLALARVTAAVTAVITTAAVVPVLLLSRGPEGGFSSAANSWPAPNPFTLPRVGAAGFTATIYPPAVPAQVTRPNALTLCPSPAGLQEPGPSVAVASLAVLRQWAQPKVNANIRAGVASQLAMQIPLQAFTTDLRLSDRAFWPTLASAGISGSGITEVIQQVQFLPVIYSGPLRGYHPADGQPSVAPIVANGCGSRIVRDTWLIVSGHAASPAREAETLFLKRRGRVLLYNATSRSA